VANIRRNVSGRQFLAIRSNERAAAALGISVSGTKILAFTVAAFLAGLAGTLNAYRFEGVGPDSYAALTSVALLAVVYLGGITSISGAVFAGMLITGGFAFQISHRLFHAGRFDTLFSGVGLVLTVLLNPEGVSGFVRADLKKHSARMRKRLRRRAGSAHDVASGLDIATDA
jgi:branched-chain amino acid transport system permease protein